MTALIVSASSKASTFLNLPGYIPVVRSFSRDLRKQLTTAQIVTGVSMTILSASGTLPTMLMRPGLTLLGHSAYNLARTHLFEFPVDLKDGYSALTGIMSSLLIDGVAYRVTGLFSALKLFF
jgi:hypothetical protein